MLIRRKVEIGTLEFIFEEILIVKMVNTCSHNNNGREIESSKYFQT